jgi:hypothetical protein
VTEFRVEASLSQCTALCKREFQRKLGCQGNSAKYTTFLLSLYSVAEPLQCERRWLFVRCIIIQSCSHCRIKWQKVSVKFQLPFQFQRKKLGVCAVFAQKNITLTKTTLLGVERACFDFTRDLLDQAIIHSTTPNSRIYIYIYIYIYINTARSHPIQHQLAKLLSSSLNLSSFS